MGEPLRQCASRRHRLYPGRRRRYRASRRADGRARLGGRLRHQQRQHVTIDGAGPAVWRALRFRLQARRHRRRNLKADRWRGADLVFDATYSEAGFVETAKTVRQGGSWIVLGVGPGKTTRIFETESPVDSILAERGARHVNINLLRYFSEPATLDDEAKAFLQRGLALAMDWAVQGLVMPHIARTIDSTVEAINAGLQSLKSGAGTLGKVAVIVDRDLAEAR